MTIIETQVKLIERLFAQGLCSSLVGCCDYHFHNSCVKCKRLVQKLTNVCYQLRHPVEYDTLSRLAENVRVLYLTNTLRITHNYVLPDGFCAEKKILYTRLTLRFYPANIMTSAIL